MFEKWRIKEHMDVADSAGRHVGTVDSVDDSRIKLTRSDSADGTHHYVDIDSVERIEDDRVTLKAGTPLPTSGSSQYESANAGSAAERAAMGGPSGDSDRSPAANQAMGGDMNYSRHTAGAPSAPGEDRARFGTSGQGTGMGGSGSGSEN